MKCEICTFEEIYDVWDKELWPNRISKIEFKSALFWQASFWTDWGTVVITKNRKEIWQYEPTFFCIRDNGKIVGVNSGFMTEKAVLPQRFIYRSRGLWVHPDYRGRGFSTRLLENTITQARLEKSTYIWTMPRKDALPAYEKVGFKKIGKWMDEGVEFGPNCLAIHKLL